MAEAKKATTKTTKKKAAEAELVVEAVPETPVEVIKASEAPKEKKTTAKAGKRSAKAAAETEAKQAKEARKTATKEAEAEKTDKPKVQPTISRPLIERRGKKFRKVAEQIESGKAYSVAEAVELATKTSPTKFDATVELHMRLNVDPRQADQNLRDTVVLPAGTGKNVRVAVFADADGVTIAKQAGADLAAADEFLQQLDKGLVDFDILISIPANMPKLGKYARLLGPKGLMPNPKSGTVTNDLAKAVSEAKAGRVEYRVDSTGIIHVGVGKVSFGADKLRDNTQAILNSVKANKPSSVKGSLVKSIYVTTSMGPSILVDANDV